MPLQPGTRLGPYEIVAPLGAGGMGEVYRASDTRLGREVAIKVLPEHLSGHPEVRARFEREAKTISGLHHPHICTLFDVGSESGTDFLVMELIEGETLAARLQRGALAPSEALRLGAQIADALDRAHRAGVVHRDLKPGNVMLTRAGAILMDFGLARATGLSGTTAGGSAMGTVTHSPTMAAPLTAEGTIVGTFQYMSPEQLEGREAGASADLWALGCVLYEMATGQRAFAGTSQASLISAIMKEQPRPLDELLPADTLSPLTEHLDRLVRQCLAKDPEQRLHSARDVKLQLEWIAASGSQASAARPALQRTRRGRERLLWVSAMVLVVAGAGATLLARPSQRTGLALEAALMPPEGGAFASSVFVPQPLAISPDGSTIVFVARLGAGAEQLWVRRLDSDQPRALAGTEGANSPFFSPDGRSIAFFAGLKLKRVDIAGGPVISLADATDPRGGTWGRNGDILFAPESTYPIHRVHADGGPVTVVTVLDSASGEATHRYPMFLPDGKRFLYLSRRAGAGAGREPAILSGTLGSGERRQVMAGASNLAIGSGHLLFVRGGVLMAQRFDERRLTLTGPLLPLAEDVSWEERFSRGVFAVSTNGVLVYSRGSSKTLTQLAWLDRAGRMVARVGEPAQYTYGGLPDVSPDGRMAAMAVLDHEQGRSAITIVDLVTGRARRLTVDEQDHPAVTWLPDGGVVCVDARSMMQLVTRSLGGVVRDTVLRRSGVSWWPLDTSPDGRHLLTWCSNSGLQDGIFALPLAGDTALIPVSGPSGLPHEARFSPDGRFVAFSAYESGRSEVFVVPFPGTGQKWQVSKAGGSAPRWNPRGGELFFIDRDNHVQSAEIAVGPLGIQVGEIRSLFQFRSASLTPTFDVAPDGQRFLVTTLPEGQGEPPIALVTDWPSRPGRR